MKILWASAAIPCLDRAAPDQKPNGRPWVIPKGGRLQRQ
jgi:hypothetical protein